MHVSKKRKMKVGTFVLASAVAFALHAGTPAQNTTHAPSTLAPHAQALTHSAAKAPHTSSHVQSRRLTPAERPPVPVSKKHLRQDYDRPANRATLMQAQAACEAGDFANASGAALVAAVKNATVECLNTLYSLTGDMAGRTFSEAKMITVADALGTASGSYAGNNNDRILQLITFLRAGYYVQFYDSDSVGSYGQALRSAIRPALDAFVANPHFDDVSDSHGEVLSEFVTLIDSAGENAHQLDTVLQLLADYDSRYRDHFYMMTAVNGVFTVLFRGHQNDDFRQRVESDPSVVDALDTFITHHADEAGTEREYLLSNAAREMARFLQYPGLISSLRPKLKQLLDQYDMTGSGASIWVATASTADYYDHDQCSYYGICDYQSDLKQAVLPVHHDCGDGVVLRAQEMSQQEVADTCAKVLGETDYFHGLVGSNGEPVEGDQNSTLELDVFDSSTDYQTYSGAIFGNSTDNGGIYLEGDPTDPSNQARFIAYEAEWMRPDFEIWNLTHEYVHYLDGRFDMKGDFNDYLTVPSIWWMEGLAEYISYSYRQLPYTEAVAAADTHAYSLGDIMDNTYNSGEERVYRWGYLAVRYMFEKQRQNVSVILDDFRQGDYPAYASFLGSLQGLYEAEWDQWLTCFHTNQGDTATCGGVPTPPPGQTDPGDPDPGDPNPGDPDPGLPACSNPDGMVLDIDCQRSGIIMNRAGDYQYFYVPVPADAPSLTIRTSGGSGDADLYVDTYGWPSVTSHAQASEGDGNTEQVVVTPQSTDGYVYIAVYAKSPYADVTISVEALGD